MVKRGAKVADDRSRVSDLERRHLREVEGRSGRGPVSAALSRWACDFAEVEHEARYENRGEAAGRRVGAETIRARPPVGGGGGQHLCDCGKG